MEVVLHKGIVEEAEVTGERRLLGIKLLLKRLDGRLNLVSSALLLIGADDLLTLLEVLFLAYVKVNGDLLIKLRNLCAEITRAGVYYKIFATILVYINLDKVVAAAKSAERTLKSLGILEISVATELCKVKALLSALPNVSAAGDEVSCLIYLCLLYTSPSPRD